MNEKEIEALFKIFQKQMPKPKGELNYTNSYTLLIAVVLSAQATDLGVNKATGPLFEIADTPGKMMALGEKTLRDHIKTIGLFNTKAKHILALSKILVEKHGEEVPRNRKDLEELPGVGRKTASVVLNIAFGEPTIAVDTHVFRIANRTGLAPGNSALEVEKKLEKVTPAEYRVNAHHWLILHGRYVCKAQKPDCQACIIAEICKFKGKLI